MTEGTIISQLLQNFDFQAIGGSSVAAVLVAVWIFAKMIRKIISVAFTLCIVFVLLRVGGVDFAGFLGNLLH